jgi:hypothetical protein
MKCILKWFELASGLWANFHKSSLNGVNLDDNYTYGMASSILRRWDRLPVRYLGLPLGANPKRLST